MSTYKSPEAAVAALCKARPSSVFDKAAMSAAVEDALAHTPSPSSADLRKSKWELALKSDVFDFAMQEGDALKNPKTTYYDELKYRFDLILTFTDHDACDQTFPFSVLQDLLETQTIPSCSHIFSWIEARAGPLTADMVPQKGKALIILRTLNDLLRRLSKMGASTIFCGRILTFLSAVFPLGERSGVNLRGEYGPIWEGVEQNIRAAPVESKASKADGGETESANEQAVEGEKKADGDAMQVDAESAPEGEDKDAAAVKDEFYSTFWSLQLPFSRPPVFAGQVALKDFRAAVERVLPVFKEATAKERALSGSRSSQHAHAHAHAHAPAPSQKRKRSATDDGDALHDYFFAKFLTSPELLDLEIADTHFRRQVLFQLLVLLDHLQTFTPASKAQWTTPRNRSLQMDFTLEPDDARWAADTRARALDELRQTAPGGRAFADAVVAILDRERGWVRWKNDLCTAFDREPREPPIEDETRERRGVRAPPEPWPHPLGSTQLSEIWNWGYTGLRDLENPFDPGEVKDYAKKIKQADALIAQRKSKLEQIAAQRAKARSEAAASAAMAVDAKLDAAALGKPTAADGGAEAAKAVAPAPTPVVAAKALPPDPIVAKHEEAKQRHAWLALRVARERHYSLLAKCDNGDVLKLQEAIEEDDAAREDRERAERAAAALKREKEGSASVTTKDGETPEVEMRESVGVEEGSQAPTQGTEGEGVKVEAEEAMQPSEGDGAAVPAARSAEDVQMTER